jgi:transcriptional regulator with XRE-family HTH domain
VTPKKTQKSLRVRFGKRVRDLRRNANLTQERLAEKAKISVDFLSLIERGINAPSFENIENLARALGLPVAELFSIEKEGTR